MTVDEIQKLIKTVVASIITAVSALWLVYTITGAILRVEIKVYERMDEHRDRIKALEARDAQYTLAFKNQAKINEGVQNQLNRGK